MGWNKVSEKELPFGEEVIAFNKEWIDEDFNPNGTRVGFLQDDGFVSGTMSKIVMIHAMKKEMIIIREFQASQKWTHTLNSLYCQICQHIGWKYLLTLNNYSYRYK